MKIILCGLGKVGHAVIQPLVRDQHDIVVIDQKHALVEDVVNVFDVRGIMGNCASYDVLHGAFDTPADLLIACTSSDEVNIVTCLVAKKLGIAHTIARIRNPEYEKQLRFMRAELGLSMVVNPEKAVARQIARVLRFPSAIKVEHFSKQRFEVIEYRIGANNPLDGISLADLYRGIRVKLLICAVTRGQDVVIPDGSFVLREGDIIYITATPRQLEQFFRKLGLFKARAKRVMIIGASRIAYYLAKDLCDMHMEVTIIDNDRSRCRSLSEQLPEALIIHGDASDSELLDEEGIEDMDSFVALTGMDETNIILSVYASQCGAGKVITKINNKSFEDMAAANSMVDTVVSAGSATSETILLYLRAMENSRGSSIKTLHRLVGGRVEALEFNVRPGMPFVDIPIRDLSIKSGTLIAGIVHPNGKTLVPSGDDVIHVGDDVIIITSDTSLRDLRDIIRN